MPTEQHKALTRRVVEEIWNKGDLFAIDQLFAPDFVLHDPANPLVKTRRDYEQLVTAYRRAFPDLRLVVEDQIAEGSLVMTWWGAKGTHTGPLFGYTPTEKPVMFTGVTIDLVHNGQITETRVNWDALGLFQQLGTVPSIAGVQPVGVGVYAGAQAETRSQ